jgi:CrcB-like protein, Camphor Resistance (CrcB)
LGGYGYCQPYGNEIPLWHICDQYHCLRHYWIFVGAYSTFSTFEWETFSNLQLGSFLIAGLYVALSIFLGLVAVWCGVLIARVIP